MPRLMLLRNAQLAALADDLTEDFRLHMARQLRETFASWAAGRDDRALDHFIRDGMDRAGRYGIKSSAGMGSFIVLLRAFGDDFDTERPWAAKTLKDEAIKDPEARIEMVVRMARDVAKG